MRSGEKRRKDNGRETERKEGKIMKERQREKKKEKKRTNTVFMKLIVPIYFQVR